MTLSRRKFLQLGAGAAGAYFLGRTLLGQSVIDSTKSNLEKTIARYTDSNAPQKRMPERPSEFYQDAQALASRLKGLITETTIDYKGSFTAYNNVINDAQSLEQRPSTESERITYTSIRIIALMYQADLLVKKAGNNIVKNETINLAGFNKTVASTKSTDEFYNKLKALENYETVMRIHEDVEKAGQMLPKNIGYRMGLYGDIASRNFVNEKMYEVITALLGSPNLPAQYHAPFKRRAYELANLNQAKSLVSN